MADTDRAQILIADDDPRIREILVSLAVDLGAETVEAETGEDAIERIEAQTFDLVLLDMAMPRLGGLGVLQRLKAMEMSAKPAVIAITAMDDAETRTRGTELGAIDFIEKPFRGANVKTRIQRALSIVSMERRLQIAEKALEALRLRDTVTGVGATSHLYAFLEAEFLAAQLGNRAMSCVVVADEGYEEVLENEGRDAGEVRLHRLATRLEEVLRGSDRIFRMDASEFVLILPATPAKGVRRVVEKIYEVLEAEGQENLSDAVCIAVATFPHPEIAHASQLFRAVNVTLAKARTTPDTHVLYFESFEAP